MVCTKICQRFKELYIMEIMYLYTRSECGGTLNEPDGYVTSPGYHLNGYPDIVHCEWIILSATGQTLSLKFVEDFSLEDDKDYVQVRKLSNNVFVEVTILYIHVHIFYHFYAKYFVFCLCINIFFC